MAFGIIDLVLITKFRDFQVKNGKLSLELTINISLAKPARVYYPPEHVSWPGLCANWGRKCLKNKTHIPPAQF